MSTQAERIAKDLLDRARAEIVYAENKASILLAGSLAGIGGITAAITGEKWPIIHATAYVSVPFWAAAAAVLAGVVLLASAIYPRGFAQKPGRLSAPAFFGDVVTMGSPAQLRLLLDAAPDDLVEIWIDQVWQNSVIASRKYRYVQWSLRMFGCALVLSVIAGAAAGLRS